MENIDVAIIMGSDSDLNIMKDAAKFLDDMNISYEMKILSVHRTPEKATEYVEELKKKKVKVVIGGAGGAAHLPGVIAAQIPIPVIGVPIYTKTLNGIDSLYSIVQMPSGIPVATVAINGAKNAAILATTILGISDETIKQKGEKIAEFEKIDIEEIKKQVYQVIQEEVDPVLDYRNDIGNMYEH